jgi:hypothetical protein
MFVETVWMLPKQVAIANKISKCCFPGFQKNSEFKRREAGKNSNSRIQQLSVLSYL